MIYLSSPYAHKHKEIRQARFEEARNMTSMLLNAGLAVYSPIVYGHQFNLTFGTSGWEFWKKQDLSMLDRCDGMVILELPGWSQSAGIANEVAHANLRKKPVYQLAPHTLIADIQREIIVLGSL